MPDQPTAATASLFMERMLRFLLPYFTAITPDLANARAEALETLAAYGGRTRSEILNAVQIIAFGFAALETLEEAKIPEMSQSMRLRYRGCANNLNRSCQLNEKSLAKHLSRDIPQLAEPIAEPIDNIPDAEAAEILRGAQAAIAAHRHSVLATDPQAMPTRQKERDNRIWGGAMIDALAGMGMPVQLVPPTVSSGSTGTDRRPGHSLPQAT